MRTAYWILLGLGLLLLLATTPTAEASCPSPISGALNGAVTLVSGSPQTVCFAKPTYDAEFSQFSQLVNHFARVSSTTMQSLDAPNPTKELLAEAWNGYMRTTHDESPKSFVAIDDTLRRWELDNQLYPTWPEIGDLREALHARDAQVKAKYQAKAHTLFVDTEEQIHADQLGLYTSFLWPGVLAVLVGPWLPAIWGARWKKKMAYWSAYSAGTRFLDPAQITAWIAAGLILFGVIAAFVLNLSDVLEALMQ